ncbi:hypothetical protein OIV19_05365 [Brucella sp. HL-2]|nr:hypothetical protein [Brucella sp. HL-2]MCV9907049.1 hypothetical protein [Brucella sp. HL-2]
MGAVMGFTPRDVDSLTLWELSVAAKGWSKANGAEEEVVPPSWDEHLAMVKSAGVS